MTADEARKLLARFAGMTWCEASHMLADEWAPDAEGDEYAEFHDEADAEFDAAREALGMPEDVDRNDPIPMLASA